jgi:acetyl-CoA carboxylase biotin carboxyl carrier protein
VSGDRGPLVLGVERTGAEEAGGRWRVDSPGVGRFVDPPPAGLRLGAGDRVGALEVLGRRRELRLPTGVAGLGGRIAEPLAAGTLVAYGDTLAWLDPGAESRPDADAAPEPSAPDRASGHAVRAPSSGRYYRRPSPDKPPFLELGDVVVAGQTVGLLEVMKTFTRIHYGGPGLPERATVVACEAEDGAEVDEGAVLIRVEAVPSGSG